MTTLARGTDFDHIGPLKPLPAFTSLGGYTILYLDTHESVLCADCATNERNQGHNEPTGHLFEEGPSTSCEECNIEIESSYGDPDTEEV